MSQIYKYFGQVQIKDNDKSVPSPRLYTYNGRGLDKTEASKNIISYLLDKFILCENVVHAEVP
jgi:hypothetical protein